MKTKQTIRLIVSEIVSRDYEEVLPNSSFASDFKSQKEEIVEVVIKVEETFGIRISDLELETIYTVQDLYDIVDKKLDEFASLRHRAD